MTEQRRLLYLVGSPGVGKTATLAEALKDIPVKSAEDKPVPHIVYPGGIQLGKSREAFGGTDAMAMNIQPKVIDWLTSAEFPYEAVIAEGDRLANLSFFVNLNAMGWEVTVAYLEAPHHILARRRAARGSNQNETWIRGRESKAASLCYAWQGPMLHISTGYVSIEEAATVLSAHDVVQALGRE